MFTASRVQATTYLLGVCLFSISFLVFLNSTVSFVITNRINQREDVGAAVGTLGFADELVALIACPLWGVLSDRAGVRTVCVFGYGIVGIALFLFVQAKNVYPQLLLARLFFSIGGAATATMVTAILPSMTTPVAGQNSPAVAMGTEAQNRHKFSPSISSELTITPNRLRIQGSEPNAKSAEQSTRSSPTRLAGFVGVFTGCGALVSLGVFLRLPAWFEEAKFTPSSALAASYYVVGCIAILVSAVCLGGLRNLNGEENKGWRAVLGREKSGGDVKDVDSHLPYWKLLLDSIRLGFSSPLIGLGYLGGFVARASSVGVSLFIPLSVNAYFISSGLCKGDPNQGTDAMKDECRRAYILAAELTGVSQLVALLCAPAFGYLADRYRRFNLPLLIAALAGVTGYVAYALMESPEHSGKHGSPWIFVVAALIGISQIGAIVCSLGLLGRGILGLEEGQSQAEVVGGDSATSHAGFSYSSANHIPNASESDETPGGSAGLSSQPSAGESSPLLLTAGDRSLNHLKGSIAGVYSLGGGAGILLLTKLGGNLFDKLSPSAPFYMLALFNGILLLAIVVSSVSAVFRNRISDR